MLKNLYLCFHVDGDIFNTVLVWTASFATVNKVFLYVEEFLVFVMLF